MFTLIFASIANIQAYLNEGIQTQDFLLNLSRILIPAILLAFFSQALVTQTENKTFQWIRDFTPFLFVLVIYFNIQDTIFLINPNDVHHALAELDHTFFGTQPSVWMEQYYHPRLTDWFALSYLNYYVISLILLILLYHRKQFQVFRIVMVTLMVSYYMGFIGYMFFPASSPYLVMSDLYQVDIWQNTSLISWLTESVVNLAPYRVRDAFPSMHNAITLLTMIMAWRYHRPLFWVQLPLALSLAPATVYLRYHYVVDIFAALPVVALAFFLTPRLEKRWMHFQKQLPSMAKNIKNSGVTP